ncbi:hypothetical protein BDF22DRAFT_744923 [Syncephalis plumigaleata]|nr:hypothetical protein BDF22DRAFT_744923 [Syncephalis plumigaleata]
MSDLPTNDVEEVCFPTIDIYDCVFDRRLNYAIMACLAISCLNSAVAGLIAGYRWSHGLLTVLFRRVDGYWLPKPVDTLLIGLWLMNTVRAIMYACTLFNWPEYRLIRTVINILGTILMPLVSTFFVVGIIAHIPSIFAQNTLRAKEPAVSTFAKDLAAQWRQYTIRLPSTTILHWVAVIVCLQMFTLYLAVGIWLNWAHEHKRTSMVRIANPIMFISMTVSTLMILIASIYYCYGFYRIMYVHVHRPSTTTQQQQRNNNDNINNNNNNNNNNTYNNDHYNGNSAEKNSAHRFRNIFLAIIVIYTTACIHTIIKGICNEYFLQKPWLHMVFILVPHALVYPTFEMAIFVNVFQSSRSQVKRAIHTMIVKSGVNLVTTHARPNYSYCTSQSKRATTSTLNHTGYDPSLVWHSLTSTAPQVSMESNKTEYIAEMELSIEHIYSTESEQYDTFVEKVDAPYASPIMSFSQSDISHETTAYDILW